MKIFKRLCVAAVLLGTAAPAVACIPIAPSPREEAQKSDAIFFAIAKSERSGPPTQVLIDLFLTLKPTVTIKGKAPSALEVSLDCGDHYPKLRERVIVIRKGKHYIIRQAGGKYEQLLTAALKTGR